MILLLVGAAGWGSALFCFSFICFPSLILTVILSGAAAVVGASIAGKAAAAPITGGTATMEGAPVAEEATDGGTAAGERTLFFCFISFPSLILTLILGGAAVVAGASISGEAAAASITGGAGSMERCSCCWRGYRWCCCCHSWGSLLLLPKKVILWPLKVSC